MYLSSILAATGVLTAAVLAAPTQQEILGLEPGQLPLSLPLSHPDYDLDLNARRLVQFGEDEAPVWVTELEKVRTPSSTRLGGVALFPTHTTSGRFKPRRKVASSLICRDRSWHYKPRNYTECFWFIAPTIPTLSAQAGLVRRLQATHL
jgi:hypothetical protein